MLKATGFALLLFGAGALAGSMAPQRSSTASLSIATPAAAAQAVPSQQAVAPAEQSAAKPAVWRNYSWQPWPRAAPYGYGNRRYSPEGSRDFAWRDRGAWSAPRSYGAPRWQQWQRPRYAPERYSWRWDRRHEPWRDWSSRRWQGERRWVGAPLPGNRYHY